MTTTPTTKPKRRRARRRKPTVATMNQQQPLIVTLPEGNGKLTKHKMKDVQLPDIKPEYQTVRVERVRPDVQLISRDAYWSDFQNRMKIHDYEIAEAMDDLKVAVAFTNRIAKKLYDRIKEVAP